MSVRMRGRMRSGGWRRRWSVGCSMAALFALVALSTLGREATWLGGRWGEATVQAAAGGGAAGGAAAAALAPPEVVSDVGDLAPDFTANDAQGRQVTLSRLRGKVVYLQFYTEPG